MTKKAGRHRGYASKSAPKKSTVFAQRRKLSYVGRPHSSSRGIHSRLQNQVNIYRKTARLLLFPRRAVALAPDIIQKEDSVRRHYFLTNILVVVTLLGRFTIAQNLRPPAAPLVTHDPYFSIWSMSDRLTDSATRHWTGKEQRLTGLVRIDGNVFRWMGDAPGSAPPLPQTSLNVTPTRTVYQFAGQGISLEVDFLSPLLANDPDVMSRPVTYITMRVQSKDT